MRVPLGVLDQSPVISGHSPAEAIAETISLARLAEELGYRRYWLAEHHGIAALADPCPEILVSRVASATSRMRVGTGGVLLPYYSALKIAEQFRMLEALFPGRIDLGIGRAPGGDPRTALAMADGEFQGAERLPQQVQDLIGFLEPSVPPGHRLAGADSRGSQGLPLLPAGARLHRRAARAPGARRPGRSARETPGAEREVCRRRDHGRHDHRRLREPADFVPARRRSARAVNASVMSASHHPIEL